MNVFLEPPFLNWEKSFDRNPDWTSKQNKLIKDNNISYADIIELFKYFEKEGKLNNSGNVGKLLYYFYRTEPITNKVSFKNDNESLFVSGQFDKEFYISLYNSLNDLTKSYTFSYIPGEYQTDDMIINYFENNIEANFSNLKRTEPPSEQLLAKLMKIKFVPVIRSMKKEWWTPKLKKVALSQDKMSILFMSSTIINRDEILDFLTSYEKTSGLYSLLFRSQSTLDKVFQEDQEIRAEFAVTVSRLSDISNDFFKDCTCEFYQFYLEKQEATMQNKQFLQKIPDECITDSMMEIILEKMPFEAITTLRRELSKTQLNTLYNNALKMSGSTSSTVVLINRMKKAGLFKISMFDDFQIAYEDLEWTLNDDDMKSMMTDEVVDYFFKKEDKGFFKTKKTMKHAGTLTVEKLLVLMKNLTYPKLKSRINFSISEDDYVYLFFTIRTTDYGVDNSRVNDALDRLIKDGYIRVSEKLQSDLEKMPENTTVESFRNIQSVFMF